MTIITFLLFLLVSIFAFTLPGVLVVSSLNKFSLWQKIILSTIIGFIFFTLVSYILLLLNIEYLIFFLVLLIDLLVIKRVYTNWRSKFTSLFRISKRHLTLVALVFAVGIIGQMAIIAPSGITRDSDLVFWSAHGHDGPWHIALMEEIKKGYPLQNPVFAGERLVNYHFFSDIAPAFFNKYLGFSSLNLYFRFFPFLYSLLLGSTAFILGKRIGKTFSAGLWASILTYFAGSFGYILTLMQNRGIGGEGIFWSSQVQSTVGNPPQILASIIVLTVCILLGDYLEKRNKYNLLSLITLIAVLPVFKVYGGVVVFISLGIISLWQAIKERTFTFLKILIPGGILASALYLPNSSQSQSFLIYEPWWFIRTMVVATDKLNLLDWELKRQTYIAENNIKRVIQLELTAFIIFFFGNLGMRFFGLWYLAKNFKQVLNNYFYLFLLSMILVSFIFPMLFLQKGVASNTIQFLQYFLLLMGIIAGVSISNLIERLSVSFKVVLSLLIIILAIPTQLGLINDFYRRPPTSKISNQELEALKFLRQNSSDNDIILTPPYNHYLDLKVSVPYIWDWFDTSYVAAFSGRRVYMEDMEQVDIMGYNYKKRQDFQKQIFTSMDISLKEELEREGIDFIYFPKQLLPEQELINTGLDKIFENDQAEIWSVN